MHPTSPTSPEPSPRTHPQLTTPQQKSSRLWNIFSIFCFPVGLYRTYSYLTSSHFITKVILPSLSADPFPENCAEKITITTSDNVQLDGVTLENPQATKWVIFFTGNGGSICEETIKYRKALAQNANINILTINYRGVGSNSPLQPDSFENLFEDGYACVEYLLNEKGIDRKNIIIEGLSLGGAVALQVACKYKLPCITENTFSSLGNEIPSFLSRISIPLSQNFNRLYLNSNCLIPMSALTLEILAFKTTLIFKIILCGVSLGKNLYISDSENALKDLITLAKTIALAPIFKVGRIATLAISLIDKRPLEAVLKCEQWIFPENKPIISQFLDSFPLHWFLHKIIIKANWEVDSVSAWNKLTARKIAFYAPNDSMIRYNPSSLSFAINDENSVPLPQEAEHNHTPCYFYYSFARYYNFIHGNREKSNSTEIKQKFLQFQAQREENSQESDDDLDMPLANVGEYRTRTDASNPESKSSEC